MYPAYRVGKKFPSRNISKGPSSPSLPPLNYIDPDIRVFGEKLLYDLRRNYDINLIRSFRTRATIRGRH